MDVTGKLSSWFNIRRNGTKALKKNLLGSRFPHVLHHPSACTVATADLGVHRGVCMTKDTAPIQINKPWKQPSSAFSSKMRPPTMASGERRSNITIYWSNCSQMSASSIQNVGSRLRLECPRQWWFEVALPATIRMNGEGAMQALVRGVLEELVVEEHFHRAAAPQGRRGTSFILHLQCFPTRTIVARIAADRIITDQTLHLCRSQWSQHCLQRKRRVSKKRPVTSITHTQSSKAPSTSTDCQVYRITQLLRSSRSTTLLYRICRVGGKRNVVAGMEYPSQKDIFRQL